MNRLLFFLILLVPVLLHAYDFKSKGIYYKIKPNTTNEVIVVSKTDGNFISKKQDYKGVITIPSTVKYKKVIYDVTGIGDDAFRGDDWSYGTKVTQVTLPNSIKIIGKRAFQYCTNLTSLDIPEGVIQIDDKAFLGCQNLTNVTLPQSLKEIGEESFKWCSSLISLKLPESLVTIGSGAFEGDKIEYIYIPNSVDSLGKEVFKDSYAKISVNINTKSSSTTFGERTRMQVRIDDWKDIELDDRLLLGFNFKSAEYYYKGQKIDELRLPEGIGKIGSFKFWNADFTRVIIPSSVKTIGAFAFDDNRQLYSIKLEEGVKVIGLGAFKGCKKLQNITLPRSLKEIETLTFNGCTSLESVTIQGAATEFGHSYDTKPDCFGHSPKLQSINIYYSSYNEFVQDYKRKISRGPAVAFHFYINNLSIKNFVIPEGITKIEDEQLMNIADIETLIIPNTVEEIGKNAFSGCRNLKELVIPASVKTIGQSAFEGCTSLSEIKFESSNTLIKSKAFHGCNNLSLVYSDNDLRYAVADAFDNDNVFMTTEGRKNSNSYSTQNSVWQELAQAHQAMYDSAEIDELAYKEAMQELEGTNKATTSKNHENTSSTSEPTIVENSFTCPTCFGRGVALDLGNWRGVTYTTCGTCGGKGVCTTYITVYPTNPNIPVVPQGGYNGGYNGGSSSTHSRNTEQEKRDVLNRTYGERCHACGGTGKCHACNGTKVAHSFGNTYECKVCRNGVCNVCNGTGKTSWNR